jgi:flagellar biosynthesis anti-sigma factor FlgM
VKIEPKDQPKIPGATSPHIQSTRRSQATGTSHDGSVNAVTRYAGDHLVLSARAEQLRRIRPQLDPLTAAPKADRVAELRILIARGVYAVDGGAVAEAMLDDEAIRRALAVL